MEKNELKNKIKSLAEEQKFLKNQKKTVNLKGERKIEPWEAYMKHRSNRGELSDLYMKYGILRGLEPERIDKNYKINFSEKFINECRVLRNEQVIRDSEK